ncbi:MAG: DUF3696 domain-containing protein [Magnetococcus sp. YQC-3]
MIQCLRLQNFKCFENATIALANLTLLTGLNGMGKSSVVQSLLVLRQSFQQGLLPERGLALNGELTNLGTAQAVLYEYAMGDQLEIALECIQPNAKARFVLDYDKNANVLKMNTQRVDTGCFLENLFTDKFQYLQAERVGPRVTFPVSEHHVQHFQLGSHGEYTSYFLEVFGKKLSIVNGLRHEREESDKLIDQVSAWLGEVSPGVAVHLATYAHMDVINLEYSYANSRGRSRPYRATSVGFGLTYTLPIVVAILAARPGAMLILENPEAHLHPQGQARIGELIARAANAGVQIILETHSDHILNGIRIAVRQGKCAPERVAIHYFFREEKDGRAQSLFTSPVIDEHGRIDKWPEGFFDEWEKSLEHLF